MVDSHTLGPNLKIPPKIRLENTRNWLMSATVWLILKVSEWNKQKCKLTSDALKIVPNSVMFYYCVWYDF